MVMEGLFLQPRTTRIYQTLYRLFYIFFTKMGIDTQKKAGDPARQ